MESIYRAAFIYLFLLIVVRVSGNRTLNEMTMFDFILILIIGDASQQAITGNDYSIINAVIVIFTLVCLDIFLSFVKQKFSAIERILDGKPVILINDGEILKDNMDKVKIDEFDILESARRIPGLLRLEQIKYAILEKDGEISILAKKNPYE